MKRALITGVTGQDGAYLVKYLVEKKYEVFGTYRRLSTPNFWRLIDLGVYDKLTLIPVDLSDLSSLYEAVDISNPDEIYHLAAQSFVQASFETPIATQDITGTATTRLLEAIRQKKPDTKFYYAATSELFGDTIQQKDGVALNENDILQPQSPYAASKLYGYWMTKIYRKGYNLFSSNGILFNHESPLRGLEFVTRKITNQVAKIKLGIADSIVLGNINAKRDWGYAPEYVHAMWSMLQQDEPDDYIIATNDSHSVKEFLEVAFKEVDLNYRDYVRIDKNLYRPLDVKDLKGDYSKANKKLGWSPKVGFNDLVKLMVRSDLNRWKKWLNGELVTWDAPNYPNENKIIGRNSNHEL